PCGSRVGGGGRVGLRCYFFFQAEDGIRDYKVTGVQTCALPISPVLGAPLDETVRIGGGPDVVVVAFVLRHGRLGVLPLLVEAARSEERRVGKESRSRRTPDHGEKGASRAGNSSIAPSAVEIGRA